MTTPERERALADLAIAVNNDPQLGLDDHLIPSPEYTGMPQH